MLIPNDKGDLPHIKLIDFGLAERCEPGALIDKPPRGSQLYLAPEAVMAQPRDPYKSDIWACGVLLFTLLALRMPFDSSMNPIVNGNDDLLARRSLARRIALGQVQWTEMEQQNLDPLAREFCEMMLSRNPARRATVQELLARPWIQ
jgi:serine/threonine protein kinase